MALRDNTCTLQLRVTSYKAALRKGVTTALGSPVKVTYGEVLVFSQNGVGLGRGYLVAVTVPRGAYSKAELNFYEDPIKCHVASVIAMEILQLPRVCRGHTFA